ncbi:Hypothetical predicted protein [Mytilus galloprovincialis]|uniref:Uncharacterized protein n=1 Tax=Mytilus galloprovincialis TaxID=29158 RepID=A0A8B6FPY4_MYTGA|nr:Hypothetical predicted protein [Mytilus galloprovincialis]
MTENHSDDEDTLLLHEPPISDQTFELFTSYFDSKISSLKNELVSLAKKLKKEVSVKLKGEGNQIQYSFNSDIVSELQKLQKRTSAEDSVSTNLISGLILKINRRNKLIRIADKSPAGWSTVREYESDDLASDSEDEKRLRQAESRALKTIKEKKTRGKPYSKPSATVSRPANSTDTSNSYYQPYNATQQSFRGSVAERRPHTTPVTSVIKLATSRGTAQKLQTNQPLEPCQSEKIQDEYITFVDNLMLFGHINVLFQHVKYFDNIDFSKIAKGVKSSLFKHIEFLKHIGANKFVLDTIEKGYIIPFMKQPPPMKFRNNKSALENSCL